MDFNANNNFLGLTTQQAAQLQKMLLSGDTGSVVKKDANGAPIVDFSSATLKETEGKKFDSNNFNFLTDREIEVTDDKDFSFKDITTKLFGMFKSTPEETKKVG